MLGLSFAPEVVILAGVCSGATLGGFLTTRTEGRRRGLNIVINPLERVGLIASIKAIAMLVFLLAGIGGLSFLIGYGVSRLGGVHRLSDSLNRPFAVAFLFGMGTGKLIRYSFWRRPA